MPKLPLTSLLCVALLPGAMAHAEETDHSRPPEITRQQVFKALLSSKIIDPDRRVVHLSHVCNLRIDNRDDPGEN